MGILTEEEIRRLIESMHSLIDIEDSLYLLIAKTVAIEESKKDGGKKPPPLKSKKE